MSNRALKTALLAAVTAFLTIAAQPRAAAAAQQQCPAAAVGFLPANAARTVFGFFLTSPKTRELSGSVALDSDRGWFRIAFGPVRTDRKEAGSFASRVLYARFPEPIRIRRAWLDDPGEGCYPPQETLQKLPAAVGDSVARSPSPGDVVIAATIRAPYGRMDCAQPFAPVRALTVVEPQFSPGQATFPGTAVVDVTVLPDGSVANAEVVEGSKTYGFDRAAVEAAKLSKYAPATAYCLPTIGHYRYKADVVPL